MKDLLKRLGRVCWWAALAFSGIMVALFVSGSIVYHRVDFVVAIYVAFWVVVILAVGRAIKYVLSGE